MIQLGLKVRDRVTGFEGIAVARIEYLTGCMQIGISPPVDKEGKLQDTSYFDHTRVEVVDVKPVLNQTNQDRGGPNRDCPR